MINEDKPERFLASKRPLAIIVATALVAMTGLLISRYAPGFLERIENPTGIVATADYDSDRYTDGWHMAFAEPFGPQGPPEAALSDPYQWAVSAGGAFVDESWIILDVEGEREGGVTITSIEARVLDRDNPLTGAMLSSPSAGIRDSIALGIDLDSDRPVAHKLDGHGDLGEPFFSQHTVTLAQDETQRFTIRGETKQSFIRWVVEIEMDIDGKRSVVQVGDSGFLVSAAPEEFQERWNYGIACGEEGCPMPG